MDQNALWEAIEAAGPLDVEESLSEPLPAGVDAGFWRERSLTQSDRRRAFIALYAWAVPSRAVIADIAAFVGPRRVLEICAGNALWSRLLACAGVDILATDGVNHGQAQYLPVEPLDAEMAVRAHPQCAALLLCWPPFRNDCAFRALRAFAGDQVVYVGDARFTGDVQFHRLLQDEWLLQERVIIPAWPGLDDYVNLYTRSKDAW